MLARNLIRTVERAGGHLEPDGDGLVVEAPEPLAESTMTELRAHKAEVIDFLNRPVARVVLLGIPPGVPEAWVQGVADLLAMTCPASCPAERWKALREGAYTFLRDHAARAHGLGWTEYDLFGVHPEKPWARPDVMGLVPMLQGRRITALAESWAAISAHGGGELTYRRARTPSSAGVCLVWKLHRTVEESGMER